MTIGGGSDNEKRRVIKGCQEAGRERQMEGALQCQDRDMKVNGGPFISLCRTALAL